MSYYFAIVGTRDQPLFEYEFGTSKQGADGTARFGPEARHMNQFIVHSSLDIVDEAQWTTGQMYLKNIDRFYNNYISCFLTPTSVKFLLLHCPDTHFPNPSSASGNTSTSSRTPSSSIAANPLAPATEEAIRQFMLEVHDVWLKTLMNPFYKLNAPIRSPVFRARVMAAGKKYL